jgi:hypothetical protein
MSLTRGTKIRIFSILLLSVAGTLSGMATPPNTKNAEGCSLVDEAKPSARGCIGGSGECYDCLHSDSGGIVECYEWPDGEIADCKPFNPGAPDQV